MIDPEKKIVLDADVIIHFIKGGSLFSLPRIMDNGFIVLDKVYEEVTSRNQKRALDLFLNESAVELINFPDDLEYVTEYAHLTSIRGHNLDSGESACLVYARYNNDVIASSNHRHISRYCDFHKIQSLSTIDLLVIGYNAGIFTIENCDNFIQTVRLKGSNLPNCKFQDIIDSVL